MAHRVLIVDDNWDAAHIAACLLAARGYATSTANDGQTALDQIAAEPPDCILLDIQMPGMSGIEVLKRLKAQPETAAIPVLFFTAKTNDQDVLDGYQAGADYYIPKPCTSEQLVYGIRLVLGDLDETPAPPPSEPPVPPARC